MRQNILRVFTAVMIGFTLVSCATVAKTTIDQQLSEKSRIFPRNPAAQIERLGGQLPKPSVPWKAPKSGR